VHSLDWLLLPGANADLSGKKLIAGMTTISYAIGSVIEEGLFLGMAENEGNRYLVVGQMNLECVPLLVTTGTVKAVSTQDWFGKVFSMNGNHLDIAWDNLRLDKSKVPRMVQKAGVFEGLAFLHLQ
jgi:hypothetical protein